MGLLTNLALQMCNFVFNLLSVSHSHFTSNRDICKAVGQRLAATAMQIVSFTSLACETCVCVLNFFRVDKPKNILKIKNLAQPCICYFYE